MQISQKKCKRTQHSFYKVKKELNVLFSIYIYIYISVYIYIYIYVRRRFYVYYREQASMTICWRAGVFYIPCIVILLASPVVRECWQKNQLFLGTVHYWEGKYFGVKPSMQPVACFISSCEHFAYCSLENGGIYSCLFYCKKKYRILWHYLS